MNKTSKILIFTLSYILMSFMFTGCSNNKSIDTSKNTPINTDDSLTNNTPSTTSTSDNTTSASISSTNKEYEYKEYALAHLEDANEFYSKIYEAVGFKIFNSTCKIEQSTSDSLIQGSNHNYIGNILYQIEYDSREGYFWLNLRVLIENKVDENNNITSLGYTALTYSNREKLTEEVIYINIDKNSIMSSTITNDQDIIDKNTDINNNLYTYFYLDDHNQLQLNDNISLNKCSNDEIQDIINEFYAIKGYKFTDKKYQELYESKIWYKGTIEDQNDITFTKSEKALLDELVSYKNK